MLGKQRLTYLIDLRFEFRHGLTQAMLVARATRTARADNGRVFFGTLSDPANIENLADAFQLASCFVRDRPGPAIAITALLNCLYSFRWLNILCAQGWREVYARTQNMWIAGRVLAAN